MAGVVVARGKIKVYKISIATNRASQKIAAKIAKWTFWVGSIFDAWLVVNKEQTWQKGVANVGMSALAFLGSWGWIATTLYAVVDIIGIFDTPLGALSDEEYEKMKKPPKSISESTRNPTLEEIKIKQEMKYQEVPKNIIKENLLPPKNK